MMHGPRSTSSLLIAAALTAGLAAGAATTARAANPLGRYENAKMKVSLELNPIGVERVSLRNGTVKVKRRKVKAAFLDLANDRKIKLDMRLATDVLDVTRQVVTVSRGDVFVKDLRSGAPIASGGEFVRGRFLIRRKNDADRTWVIRHDQRFEANGVSGILTGLSRGTLKAKR